MRCYAAEYSIIHTMGTGSGSGLRGMNAGINYVSRQPDGLFCVEKRLLSNYVRDGIATVEIKTMRLLCHPNIVLLTNAFEAPPAHPPAASRFISQRRYGSLAEFVGSAACWKEPSRPRL